MISLILLFFTLPGLSARADFSGLVFDPQLLDLSQYTLNQTPGEFQGPSGNVLQVRSEKISQADAAKSLKNRLFQLQALYAPQSAAYPGMLTKDASCLATVALATKTEETKSELFWFSEMPATQRFVYGTCGTIEEPFWSQKLLLYCKSSQLLYDIRFFRLKGKAFTKIGKRLARCL